MRTCALMRWDSFLTVSRANARLLLLRGFYFFNYENWIFMYDGRDRRPRRRHLTCMWSWLWPPLMLNAHLSAPLSLSERVQGESERVDIDWTGLDWPARAWHGPAWLLCRAWFFFTFDFYLLPCFGVVS